jgi:hypothetical protein
LNDYNQELHHMNRFLEPIIRTLVSVGLLFLTSNNLDAGVCLPPETKINSPYHYMVALADALGLAKSARDRSSQPSDVSPDPISKAAEAMLAMKLAQRDYECAASHVAPYKTSMNEAIKTSAQGTTSVFTDLVELDKQSVELYKKLLDTRAVAKDLPSYVEQAAELGAKADDIWKLLPLAVIAATYAVVEADPSTGKMSRLSLTTRQRNDILKKLKDTFGPSIEKGMQVGQLGLEASAGVLFQFLNDRQRKSPDSK